MFYSLRVSKILNNVKTKLNNDNLSIIFDIIVNNFSTSSYKPVQLGRWSLEYDSQKIEERIRLANEDHS